jgi:hypothetical protein
LSDSETASTGGFFGFLGLSIRSLLFLARLGLFEDGSNVNLASHHINLLDVKLNNHHFLLFDVTSLTGLAGLLFLLGSLRFGAISPSSKTIEVAVAVRFSSINVA